jgi:hypothetical protein
MTEQHPITPPPELVQEWVAEIWHEGTPVRVALSDTHIATRAAQWGADQELEACCVLMDKWGLDGEDLVECRRPKPPNKKQRGLIALEATKLKEDDPLLYQEILNAIEELPND